MLEKSIVYFGQTPSQGTGSPINILRHLLRLTHEGWKVSVIAEWGQDYSECEKYGWPVFLLPHRKTWWPPYYPNNILSRGIRMRLWANECRNFLHSNNPSAILTYLSCYSELPAEVAANYSILAKIPMTAIIYDYAPAFKKISLRQKELLAKRYRWIMHKAHQNWFVSEQLAKMYGFPASESLVLMPMPEGYSQKAAWRQEFAQRPLIVYAGYSYNAQIPLLRDIGRRINEAGGRLLLVTGENPEIIKLCKEEPIDFKPYFHTNKEALDFIYANAAAFLSAQCYNLEDMPWLKSSFPSKVVEFSHTGIPFLFVSPKESASYLWNEKQKLPYNLLPENLNRINDFVNALKSPSTWQDLAKPMCSLAASLFNPDTIQRRLVEHFFV
ncbi:MAG: hypothetical protein WC546_03175 [Candidatus Omnitrophota bacterium]